MLFGRITGVGGRLVKGEPSHDGVQSKVLTTVPRIPRPAARGVPGAVNRVIFKSVAKPVIRAPTIKCRGGQACALVTFFRLLNMKTMAQGHNGRRGLVWRGGQRVRVARDEPSNQ